MFVLFDEDKKKHAPPPPPTKKFVLLLFVFLKYMIWTATCLPSKHSRGHNVISQLLLIYWKNQVKCRVKTSNIFFTGELQRPAEPLQSKTIARKLKSYDHWIVNSRCSEQTQSVQILGENIQIRRLFFIFFFFFIHLQSTNKLRFHCSVLDIWLAGFAKCFSSRSVISPFHTNQSPFLA